MFHLYLFEYDTIVEKIIAMRLSKNRDVMSFKKYCRLRGKVKRTPYKTLREAKMSIDNLSPYTEFFCITNHKGEVRIGSENYIRNKEIMDSGSAVSLSSSIRDAITHINKAVNK